MTNPRRLRVVHETAGFDSARVQALFGGRWRTLTGGTVWRLYRAGTPDRAIAYWLMAHGLDGSDIPHGSRPARVEIRYPGERGPREYVGLVTSRLLYA